MLKMFGIGPSPKSRNAFGGVVEGWPGAGIRVSETVPYRVVFSSGQSAKLASKVLVYVVYEDWKSHCTGLALLNPCASIAIKTGAACRARYHDAAF